MRLIRDVLCVFLVLVLLSNRWVRPPEDKWPSFREYQKKEFKSQPLPVVFPVYTFESRPIYRATTFTDYYSTQDATEWYGSMCPNEPTPKRKEVSEQERKRIEEMLKELPDLIIPPMKKVD